MTTYIHLGGGGSGSSGSGGSAYWADPVSSFAALPGSDPSGTVRVTTDTGIVYWWDGATWEPLDAEVATPAVTDSNSVDHTVTGGVLSSDVRLSGDAATAGFFKATVTVKTGGSPGLHVEIPEASGSQTGVLKSADWSTFSGKEDAIAAGTGTQYWDGTKSWTDLNLSALTAVTNGASASSGTIGELQENAVAVATTGNVAATGAWGFVTSTSLTAGVWILTGVVGFNENGATLTTAMAAGFSTSSSGPVTDTYSAQVNALISGSADAIVAIPFRVINISSTQTWFLNTKFTYTSGTPAHYGRIIALRIR